MAIEDDFNRRNRNKSWWQQRTKMESRLIFVLIVALLLIIGLAIGTGVAAAAQGKPTSCTSDVCVKQAAYLLERMNTSVDPCDDFYEFACGRYIQETELPGDKLQLEPLSIIGDLIHKQVTEVIAEESKPGEIRPFTFAKKLYAACLDTDKIDRDGLDHLKAIFRSLGGWPMLEGYNWIESSWIDLLPKLRQHGLMTTHFFSIASEINIRNNSEYIIMVDQALNEEIGEDNLKKGYQDDLVRTYAEYLTDLVVFFGVDRNFARKEVQDVLELRQKIAQLSAAKLEHTRLILSANETTVGALLRTYPTIPWIELLNGVLAIPNKSFSSQDRILVLTPDYVAQLERILNETPRRVPANLVTLQILRSSVNVLPLQFRDRMQQFLSSAFGVTAKSPRWEDCLSMVTENFNLATDALYVRKYVDEQARKDVTEMVSHIREAFLKILKDVDWMDSNTRRQAIEKAETIKPHIAYPVELRDDKALEDYYAQLKYDSNNILDLINESAKFKKDKAVEFYGRPVVKSHWTTRMAAISSNAVYDPQANSIQIPSGIMQKDFYNKERPQYMNYGTLGMVIGHEITHGFDNTGKAFDKNGNSVNWWEPSTLKEYSTKAQCFVEQYSKYVVPEIKMNVKGENTLGENIADNGGIKESYLAYMEWIKRNKEELPLAGMNYTSKQLYWISLANAWCTKMRPSILEQLVVADEHAPHRIRILGGLSNMQSFAKDFNCPVGSKMNPAKKCQVW